MHHTQTTPDMHLDSGAECTLPVYDCVVKVWHDDQCSDPYKKVFSLTVDSRELFVVRAKEILDEYSFFIPAMPLSVTTIRAHHGVSVRVLDVTNYSYVGPTYSTSFMVKSETVQLTEL